MPHHVGQQFDVVTTAYGTHKLSGEKNDTLSSYHLNIQNNKEIKEFLAIWTLLQLCNYTFSER